MLKLKINHQDMNVDYVHCDFDLVNMTMAKGLKNLNNDCVK